MSQEETEESGSDSENEGRLRKDNRRTPPSVLGGR